MLLSGRNLKKIKINKKWKRASQFNLLKILITLVCESVIVRENNESLN